MLLCLSVGCEFLYPVILISIVIGAECYGEIFKIGIENIFTVTLGGSHPAVDYSLCGGLTRAEIFSDGAELIPKFFIAVAVYGLEV